MAAAKHPQAACGAARQRFDPICPAELDRLWSVPLDPAHDAALSAAFKRDPELRRELGMLLCNLDDELRESFNCSLASALDSPLAPISVAFAAQAALARTRVAAFWYRLMEAPHTAKDDG